MLTFALNQDQKSSSWPMTVHLIMVQTWNSLRKSLLWYVLAFTTIAPLLWSYDHSQPACIHDWLQSWLCDFFCQFILFLAKNLHWGKLDSLNSHVISFTTSVKMVAKSELITWWLDRNVSTYNHNSRLHYGHKSRATCIAYFKYLSKVCHIFHVAES